MITIVPDNFTPTTTLKYTLFEWINLERNKACYYPHRPMIWPTPGH
jgi:hypothetical protein